MLVGGALLLIASGASGEWRGITADEVTLRGVLSLLYLIVFGSLIGFSAYKYLLGRVRPALVGTYAFVNPVVAVALGTAFAGEVLTTRLILAMSLIVGAVAMISLRPYFSRP
jgi:drug/metabolite transporter (DMT)-like permease